MLVGEQEDQMVVICTVSHGGYLAAKCCIELNCIGETGVLHCFAESDAGGLKTILGIFLIAIVQRVRRDVGYWHWNCRANRASVRKSTYN